MGREWKPGDVAAAVRYDGMRVMRLGYGEDRWMSSTEGAYYGSEDDLRPLVVIDAEDREQVEALRDALNAVDFMDQFDTIQAALRSLITPPKPDEPLGLGAVVEDADGTEWVRVRRNGPMFRQATEPGAGRFRSYADITAVRVLSEGVTQ